jgi:hypothetical protein
MRYDVKSFYASALTEMDLQLMSDPDAGFLYFSAFSGISCVTLSGERLVSVIIGIT